MTLRLSRDELKRRTLRNNLVWLAGFGCRVEWQHACVYVQHAELETYTTWVVPADASRTGLAVVLSEMESQRPASTLHVDADGLEEATRALLVEWQFEPGPASVTVAVQWHPGARVHGPEADVALASNPGRWAELYSEGFGRTGAAADVDRRRWSLAFRRAELKHWIVLSSGEEVGVCQTCHSDGVVGVYSLTLAPQHRRKGLLLPVLSRLEERLTDSGPVVAYFERSGRRSRRRQSGHLGEASVICHWESYQRRGPAGSHAAASPER